MALLAAYSFDAGTGTTVIDDSGNSKTLTLTANGAWTTGHTASSVVAVDATQAAASGSVTLPGITAFTVMGWFKNIHSGAYASMLMVDDGAGNKRIRMGRGGSYALHFELVTNAGSAWVFTADDVVDSVPPIDWAHYAAVWDGLNLRIYYNGTLQSVTPNGSGTVAGTLTGATRLLIGGDAVAGTSNWDDVRIYDEALSQATITTLMNTPVPYSATSGSGIFFSDGSEAEGVYMWDGATLQPTQLIKKD